MLRLPSLFALVLGFAVTFAVSSEAADIKAGKKVFRKCQACHALQAGKNKVGPTLYGLIGRTAGTTPKYRYSKANKNSGVVWTPEALDKYLQDPRKFIPKTKMVFPGLKKAKDRANLIAYLIEATKAK